MADILRSATNYANGLLLWNKETEVFIFDIAVQYLSRKDCFL